MTRPGPTPAAPSQALARQGEALAADFLRSRGHVVLGTRVRTAAGEADLVTQSGRHLYFVEVKTRTARSRGVGGVEAAIDGHRASRMRAVANALWPRFGAAGMQPHVAVCWLDCAPGRARLSFLPDAVDG